MSMRLIRNLISSVCVAALFAGAALAGEPSEDVAKPAPTDEAKPAPTDEAEPAPTKKAEPVPTKKAGPVPTKKAAPVPTKKAEPAPVEEPTLPEGTFVGTLRKGDQRFPLRVTVVAGMIVHAEAGRGASLTPLTLKPAGAPDAAALRLTGRDGSDYLQVKGAFFDVERGAGEFDGVFARKRVQGTWVLARR